MKLIATALFTLLVTDIIALPQDDEVSSGGQERNLITGQIQAAIDQLIETILRLELDPAELPNTSRGVYTPIGWGKAWVKDANMTGLSNIQTIQLDWGVISRRLRFTFRMPRVVLSTTSIGYLAEILGRKSSASITGSVEFINLQITGDMRFEYIPIAGASMTNCNMVVSGRVESDALVSIGDHAIGLEGWARYVTHWLRDNGASLGQQICNCAGKLI